MSKHAAMPLGVRDGDSGGGQVCDGKNPGSGAAAGSSPYTDPESPIATDYTVFLVNEAFCTAATTNILDLQSAGFADPSLSLLPDAGGSPQWTLGGIATTGYVSSCEVAVVPVGTAPSAAWRSIPCAAENRAGGESVLTGPQLTDPARVYDVWVRVNGWDSPVARLVRSGLVPPALTTIPKEGTAP